MQETGPVAVSTLTMVEMRALLARRRERDITARIESQVFAAFEEDLRRGALIRHPVHDGVVQAAALMLAFLTDHPVRSLDALHLAMAREIGTSVFATADRVQAGAARALGMKVVRFD